MAATTGRTVQELFPRPEQQHQFAGRRRDAVHHLDVQLTDEPERERQRGSVVRCVIPRE